MAGRGDIMAGRAFVELFLKNRLTPQLTKALLNAKKQLNGMASAARFVGGTFNQLSGIALKAGTSIVAPFVAALSQLKEGQFLFKQIGKALAQGLGKPLIPILKQVRDLVRQFAQWAKLNPELIRTIFKIGVGLVAASVAFKALGSMAMIAAAGLALSATAMGTLAAIVATIGTPIGATVVALGLATVAWAKWTASGKAATTLLMGKLRQFSDFALGVFKGIADAIMGGDLELAAKIAMDGVKVAFLSVKLPIITAWEDIKLSVQNSLDSVGVANRTVIAFLGTLWNSFSKMVAKTFPEAMRIAAKAWNIFAQSGLNALSALGKATNMLSRGLGKVIDRFGKIAGMAGKGVDAALPDFEETDIGGMIGMAAAAAAREAQKARDELAGPQMEREANRAGVIDQLAGELAAAQEALANDKAQAAAKAARPLPAGFDFGGEKPTVTFSGTGLLAAGQGGGQIGQLKKANGWLEKIHREMVEDRRKPLVMGP